MKLIIVKYNQSFLEPTNIVDVIRPVTRIVFNDVAHIDATKVTDVFLFNACNETTQLVCLYNIKSKIDLEFLYNKLKSADELLVDKKGKEPFKISPTIVFFIDFELDNLKLNSIFQLEV